MSAALPGQRTAQRPLRAAKASQAALGRAATGGGARVGKVISHVGGETVVLTYGEDGVRHEAPCSPGAATDNSSSEGGA